MSETSKCRISHVDLSTASLNPLIVEFQNGTLKPEAAKHLQCDIYENNQTKRRCVSVVDGNSSYLGHELTDECSQTFLAIRNRKTNEVCFVSTSKVLLAPVLDNANESSAKESPALHDTDIYKTFGSKKDQRRAKQRDDFKFSIEAVKKDLQASASSVVVKEEEFSNPQDAFSEGLPPCNRSAKTAGDVYKMSDFISNEEIIELSTEAHRVMENGEKELESEAYDYSGFYRFLLPRILALSKEDERVRKLAILTYMECIYALMNTPGMKLQNPRFDPCPCSSLVSTKLMSKFTSVQGKGWHQSLEQRDLAFCNVLLLALLLSGDFHLPVDIIFESCSKQRLKITQLDALCRAVAVSLVSVNGRKHAALSLPLPEQVTMKRPSGGRRNR